MNGEQKQLAAYIGLGLSIIGLAFWVGVESAEIAQMRVELSLLSPITSTERLAIMEERQKQMEQHLESIDGRLTQMERRR